jgi:hypothetical protein
MPALPTLAMATVAALTMTLAGAQTGARAADGDGTIATFDAATAKAWAATTPAVRKALFVTAASNAYAQYELRASGDFRPGETANVYLEPVGYGFAEDGGLTHVRFSTAVEIQRADGIVMAQSPAFGTFDWAGHGASPAVPVTVSVALPDLKDGDYWLIVTLTDETSGKALSATLPFAIAR